MRGISILCICLFGLAALFSNNASQANAHFSLSSAESQFANTCSLSLIKHDKKLVLAGPAHANRELDDNLGCACIARKSSDALHKDDLKIAEDLLSPIIGNQLKLSINHIYNKWAKRQKGKRVTDALVAVESAVKTCTKRQTYWHIAQSNLAKL